MANKTLKIDLLFNANVKEALRQMLQLQQSLSLLATSQPMTNFSLTSLLKEAQRSAMDLKIALNNAMNVDTGRLNLNKFQSELNRSGKSILQYAQQLQVLGPSGVRAFLQVALAVAQADTKMFNLSGGAKKLMDTLGNTVRWQLTSSAIHGVMSAFSDTISYAKELDTSLNNIRIVTGKSADLMARFAKEANSMAKQLSTTTTKYSDASLIYYQLGLNDKEVKERTDTTVKLANVTGETAELVSEWMTSIWNNFDDGTMALERYADMIAKLGAATASSADEIATGLEKFAAVADTVGLSYEYATSALATVTAETRQSADVVGTAFKTLFARIEGLKFGETLEDGTDLNQYSLALQKVGVNIKDANGELKDMDTILDLTGARWLTLNKDQLIALAQQVAGIRQYNQFMALMENWDVMLDNLKLVEQSNGALEELNRIYEESMAASQERMKAASEELKALIIGGDDLIPLYNFAGGALEVITELLEAFGGLPTIILGVATALTKLYLPQIASFASLLGVGFTSAFSSIKNGLKGKGFTSTSNFKTDTAMTAANMAASAASTEQDSLALFTLSLTKIDIARIENESKLNEAAKQRIEWLRKELEMKLLLVLEGEKAVLAANEEVEAKGNALINKGYLGEDIHHLQGLSEKLGQLLAHGSLAQTMVILAQTMGGATMNTLSREDFKTNMSKLLDEMKSKASALGGSVKDISFKPVEDSLLNFVNTGKGLDDLLNKIKELNSELNQAGQGTLNTTIGEMVPEQDEAILRKSSKTYDGMAAVAGLLENDSINTAVSHLDKIDENKFSSKTDKDYISKKKSQAKTLQAENKALKDKNKWMKDNNKTEAEYNKAVEKNDKAIKKFNKDTAKSMSTLKKNSKTLKTNIRSTKEYENGIKDVGKELKDFSSESTDAAKSAEGLEEATTTLNQEAVDMEENIRNGGSSFTHWSDNLANGLNTAMQFAMGLSMITSAAEQMGKALGSNNHSMGDWISNISSMLMGITMLLPSMISLTKGIYSGTQKLITNTKATIANIIAKRAEKIATEDVSASEKKGILIRAKETGSKIVSGMASIGKAIAENPAKGIAVAAAALPFLIAAGAMAVSFSSGKSEGEKEAKQEEVSKGTESLEAIKENQELSESVTDLTKEYNALRNAGESTADVLEDMREKIPELIDSYKELAKTMGTPIDTSSLEEAYENFLITGDTSLLEKALEKLDKDIEDKKYSTATSTAATAKDLVVDAAREGDGRLKKRNGTFVVRMGDANAKDNVDNLMAEELGEYWKDNNRIEFDTTNTGEVIDAYNKMIAARDRIKKEGKEDSDTYRELNREIQAMAESMGDLINAQLLQFEIEKELALLEEEFNSELGLKKVNSVKEYEDAKTDLIEKLKEEKQWTEALAEAYLKASKTYGGYAEAADFFSESGLGFNKDASEQTIKDIKEWFADLPEEERTLAMTIDYTTVANVKEAEVALEEAREKMRIAAATKEATELGADADTFETYAKILQVTNSHLKENEAGAYEVAAANVRVKKGLEDLNSTWSKSLKKIQSNTVGSYEYAEGLSEITESLKTLLGSDWLDVGFTSKHLNEVEALLNGNYSMFEKLLDEAAKYYIDTMAISEDALYGGQLAIALSTDEIQNALTNLLDSLGDPSIGVEMTLENEQYLNTLQAALDAGQITQDLLEEAFRLKGYDVNFTTHQVPGPTLHVTRTYKGPFGIGEYTVEYDETSTMTVPLIGDSQVKVNGEQGTTKPKFTAIRTADETTAKNTTIDDKAAGQQKNTKKLDEEIERYRLLNETVEDLERNLDALGKAKDRAYGRAKIGYMQAERKELERNVELAKERLRLAEEYYQQDLQELSQYGIRANKDGQIENWDEILQKQINKMKGMDSSSDAYEDEELRLDDMKSAYDKYMQSLDDVKDAQLEIIDNQNAVIDSLLEEAEFKVEFKIEADEFTMEVLEHFLSRLEDDAFAAADAIALIGLQMEVTAGQIDTYMQGINNVLGATLSPEEIQKVMAGDLSNIDTSKLTEQQIEDLKEYANGLMEIENQLREQHTAVHEKLTESIEAWNEEFDKNMAKFEKYNAVVENYKNIIDIVGKDRLGISDETIKNMYDTQKKIANDLLASAKARKESAQFTYDEIKAAYDNAVALYGEDSEIAKKWKEQMEAAEETLNDATNEFYDSWQNALLAAADAFAASVETIVENFEKSVSGAYGSLDALQEAFDRLKEINERYLDTYEKTYEINKLNRKINQDIAKTTNIKSQKELRDLQELLLDLNKEGSKVSERDIQFMQKKYDLLVAELALRDAQNAKSTVKLSRDSEGNYSYIYTADQSNIDAATQAYEDAAYNLEKWNEETLITISELIITIKQNFAQAIQDIANDANLSDEERKRKMEETTIYYTGQLKYWTDEAVRLNEYATLANSQFHMDMADSVHESIVGQIMPDIVDWEELYRTDSEAMQKASSDLDRAIDTMAYDIDKAMGEAGTSVEDFRENANEDFLSVQGEAEKTKGKITELKTTVETELPKASTAVLAFETLFNSYMDLIIQKIGSLTGGGVLGAILKLINGCKEGLRALKALEEKDYSYTGGTTTSTATGESGTTTSTATGESGGNEITTSSSGETSDSKKYGVISASTAGHYTIIRNKKGQKITSYNLFENKALTIDGYTKDLVDVNGTKMRLYRISSPKAFYSADNNNGGVGYVNLKDLNQMLGKDTDYQIWENGKDGVYLLSLDTGGYTGSWGPEGRLAMLHQKEIVLNAHDTENLLSIVSMVRDMNDRIELNARAMQYGLTAAYTANNIKSQNDTLQLEVHITAEFPNATNHSEIEEAFRNLTNLASQYANRKF